MTNNGSYDIGCGIFTYEIDALPPTPTETATVTPIGQLSSRACWKQSDFPNHSDVAAGNVLIQSQNFCSLDGTQWSPGQSSPPTTLYADFANDHIYSKRKTPNDGVNYDFRVEWKDGCITSQPKQSVVYPTDPNGATGYQCYQYMLDNYNDCTLINPNLLLEIYIRY
jgi:hypothetical protein